MAYNRDKLESALIGVQDAIKSKDAQAAQRAIGIYTAIYSADAPSYQFNDPEINQKFGAEIGDYYQNTSFYLTPATLDMLKILPSNTIESILERMGDGQDADMVKSCIKMLERDKMHAPLIHLAGICPEKFNDIQDILLSRCSEMNNILKFMETYPQQVDVDKITQTAIHYVGSLNKSGTSAKKYNETKPITDKIIDLSRKIKASKKRGDAGKSVFNPSDTQADQPAELSSDQQSVRY